MPHDVSFSGSYDYGLVSLSVVIAILAAYAALDLAERVAAAEGKLRHIWLWGGAVAMGTGIWSMHYIGMLAYSLPIPVLYDWPTVLVSLVAAVLASAIALHLVSGSSLGVLRIAIGALLMGTGIATMHYTGMAAMRLEAMHHYSIPIVSVSVVLAVVISLVALGLTFYLTTHQRSTGWRKNASAVLMGLAIPVMHYTGMAAVSFTPMAGELDVRHAVNVTDLGVTGIGAVAFLVLGLTILTSLVDRRFSAQAKELELSEHRYRQIVESAKVILWRGSLDAKQFTYVNQEAQELLGHPLQDWTNQPEFWLSHLHPDDRALASSKCDTAAARGKAQRFEHRMVCRDGRTVWLRTSVRVVTQAGMTPELVGVMTDITERKQAQEMAEAASIAKGELLIEIERLNEKLKKENLRMSAELDVTRRLQRMMAPHKADLKDIAELDISTFMEPAEEVGGDYYDVIRDDNGVVLGIGDVTGHGLESGVLAIMVHTAVRTLLASGHRRNREFFEVLNRVVYGNARRMNSDRNLTMSLIRYQDSTVTISGQHEEVLVIRNDGSLERHDTLNLGYPLGLQEDISSLISETKVPLQSGDVLVLYTDGITEAINCAGVTYGIDRLANSIRESHDQPAEGIRQSVLANLREYVGEQRLLDDISLVVVKPV